MKNLFKILIIGSALIGNLQLSAAAAAAPSEKRYHAITFKNCLEGDCTITVSRPPLKKDVPWTEQTSWVIKKGESHTFAPTMVTTTDAHDFLKKHLIMRYHVVVGGQKVRYFTLVQTDTPHPLTTLSLNQEIGSEDFRLACEGGRLLGTFTRFPEIGISGISFMGIKIPQLGITHPPLCVYCSMRTWEDNNDQLITTIPGDRPIALSIYPAFRRSDKRSSSLVYVHALEGTPSAEDAPSVTAGAGVIK